MIKEIINGTLGRYGYQMTKTDHKLLIQNGLATHQFINLDGTFDYDAYRQVQTETNKRKIAHKSWATEENIEFLCRYLRAHSVYPTFGLCHGTRAGLEQQWFIKQLSGCKVIGTEISDTAEKFPNTIKWDFHEVKPEWLDATDFIYSNALDHSYDPEKAITAWMSCVKPGGFCFLEWCNGAQALGRADVFSSDIIQLAFAITRWGKGVYCVREIMPRPLNGTYISFVMIYKF